MKGKILIVDDEEDMLTLLKRIISEETEHDVVTEASPFNALQIFHQRPFDLVITDLKMPKMDGIRFLEEVKKANPMVSVIILTAYATIETAVEAIQKGAYDYLTKPFRRDRILLTIDKVMKWQDMVRENLALRQALAEKGGGTSMLGASPLMKTVFERIKQVASTTATVLITGASGTGKELVARAIHRNSLRAEKKFITVNCTAIPENVIESELFGHIKGAFTGAWKDKRGLVEEACDGTLFLDEIGDLSPSMQTKLLRLLQEGEYKPVGSVTTKRADLRFIAATNHNLKSDIKEKSFREDLYYRLNVIHIELPLLKERKEDIPLLSHHFLKKYTRAYQKEIQEIAPSAMEVLVSQEFPGNVRELENIIERCVTLERSDQLTAENLPPKLVEQPPPASAPGEMDIPPDGIDLNRVTEEVERQLVSRALALTGGNRSRASRLLGISLRSLRYRLVKLGMDSDESAR